MYGIIANTNDGFLYSMFVQTNYDDDDFRSMSFEVGKILLFNFFLTKRKKVTSVSSKAI